MPRIAVVGGNSQVATEVALYLSLIPGVEVIPICRPSLVSITPAGRVTDMTTAFLRQCGLPCRVGHMQSPAAAKELLAGADLVADFSLVAGSAADVRRNLRSTITNLVRESPQHCRVVFISTQMALGMKPGDPDRRYHVFARTAYGANKRFGERLTRKLAAASGKEAWVLRLGSVRGELQGVSREMRQAFEDNQLVVLPDTVSDTVFCFTIAEALANISAGRERPGTYTLMSTPDWHWREICEYHSRLAGRSPELRFYPCKPQGIIGRWRHALRRSMRTMLISYRALIAVHILSRFPAFEKRITAKFRLTNAARDIAAIDPTPPPRFGGPVVGPIAGRRLTTLSDSRKTMEEATARVRAILERASPQRNADRTVYLA